MSSTSFCTVPVRPLLESKGAIRVGRDPLKPYRRLRVDQRDRLSRHAGFVLVERAVPIPAVEHTARDLTVAGRPRLLRRPWGDRALFCDSFEAPPEQPDNARTEEKNGPSAASFGANIAYACRLRADH